MHRKKDCDIQTHSNPDTAPLSYLCFGMKPCGQAQLQEVKMTGLEKQGKEDRVPGDGGEGEKMKQPESLWDHSLLAR